MNQPPIIKLSSVTNLHDARYGAGMGTHMLGFCWSEASENYIDEASFVQIAGWVAGIDIVIEIEGSDFSDSIKQKLSEHKEQINAIQIDDFKLLEEIKTYQVPILLKAESVSTLSDVSQDTLSHFKYLLIEQDKKQVFSDKEIEHINSLATQNNILLGYGISADNVIETLAKTSAKGLSFTGGKEEEIGMGGYQDFDELSDIMEKIEDYFEL